MVQKETILKLADIADRLEQRGLHKRANEVDRVILAALLQEAGIKESAQEIFEMLKAGDWIGIKNKIGKGARVLALLAMILKGFVAAGEVSAQEADQYLESARNNLPAIEETSGGSGPDDEGDGGGLPLDAIAEQINKNVKGMEAAVDKNADVLIVRVEGNHADQKLQSQLQAWAQSDGVPRFEVLDQTKGDGVAMAALDFTGDKEVGSYDINPDMFGSAAEAESAEKGEAPELGLGEGNLDLDKEVQKDVMRVYPASPASALAKMLVLEGGSSHDLTMGIMEKITEDIASGKLMGPSFGHDDDDDSKFGKTPAAKLLGEYFKTQVSDALSSAASDQESFDASVRRMVDAYKQFKAEHSSTPISDFR